MKKIFIVALMCLLAIPALAQERKHDKDLAIQNIYQLEFASMKADNIDNDIYLFYGWQPEEKEGWKKEAEEAIAKLEQIKKDLLALDFDLQMDAVRAAYINLLGVQQKVYDGIENKDNDTIENEYQYYFEKGQQYNEILKEKVVEYIDPESWLKDLFPDDFELMEFESREIKDQKDRETYAKAYDLLKNWKHFDAFHELKGLFEKYKDGPAEPIIKLRIADCFASYDSDMSEYIMEDEEQDPIVLYESIISSGKYNKALSEAFIKWRTLYQVRNEGMSNWSVMPNDFYNEKRWQIVQTIQNHLKEFPDDLWARWQILSLLDYPNIRRGGQFGNSNINHVAMFMNLDEKNEREK